MIYFRPHIRALQSQIDDLQRRLEASELERKALLDRLLERNHFEPLRQSAPAKPSAPPIQVIAPFGVQPAEIEQPLRDSWIEEEAQYIVMMHGYDPERAVEEARRRFVAQHRPIKVN